MSANLLEFKPSPSASIGLELELQLLHPDTLALVDGILPLLAIEPKYPFIHPEFNQAMVEVASQVCYSIPQLEADLYAMLMTLQAKCHALGLQFCAAGSHPFCDRLAITTPIPRYLSHRENGSYLADMMMTFALHLHIGMPSGDEAVRVMAALKPYLPVLLALSASSPFWWGQDTGFASYRHRFLSSTRTYGIPPSFPDWQSFAEFFVVAQRAQMFEIIRDIHWDLRPHPDLGTLEIRVMDAQPTIERSINLAAFVHSLVVYLQQHPIADPTAFHLEPLPWLLEKENNYRASHWGIEARYIVDREGHCRDLRSIVADLLETIAPTAEQLGELGYLRQLERSLSTGLVYQQQRQIYRETGSLQAVVAWLVESLQAELRSRSSPDPSTPLPTADPGSAVLN